MYRKRADALILRDVTARLAAMDQPDWMHAVVQCQAAHPDWFQHHKEDSVLGVGRMLEAAGLAMVKRPDRVTFIGNLSAEEES